MNRYRLTGSLLLASVAFAAIIVFGQLPGDKLLWQELQNTLHTLAFCLFCLLVLQLLGRHPRLGQQPREHYLLAGVVCVVIAVGTETAQWASGRGFGQLDVLRDLAGILLAIALHALLRRDAEGARMIRQSGPRWLLMVSFSGLLLITAYPLGELMLDYQARQRAFPVVLDLLGSWAGSFIEYQDARQSPSECPAGMASVELLPATFPGISVREPDPDWRSYRELVFSLHSHEAKPPQLVLRIHDRQHDHTYQDRYNRVLNIKTGTNDYRIPLAEITAAPDRRTLQLDQIASIMLFAWNLPQAREICVGRIRLAR